MRDDCSRRSSLLHGGAERTAGAVLPVDDEHVVEVGRPEHAQQALPHLRGGVGAAAHQLRHIARRDPEQARQLVLGGVPLLEERPKRGPG